MLNHSPAQRRAHRLAVLLLLLAGGVYRVYFVQTQSATMQSDEARVGLAATHIATHGELPIYVDDQAQHGALIAYVVAPVFALFGPSNLAFKAVTAGLSLLLAFLIYLLAKRVGDERTGLAALTLTLFAPPFVLLWSVRATACCLVMLLCGVGALLASDNILFERGFVRARKPKTGRYVACGLLGFLLGLGFWASPLIVTFAAAIWIVLLLQDRKRLFRATFLVFLLFLVAGSLPALLFNTLPGLRAGSGLAGSLDWPTIRGFLLPMVQGVRELPGEILQTARNTLTMLLGGSAWDWDTSPQRRVAAVALLLFWVTALIYAIGARAKMWLGRHGRRRWELASIDAPLLQFLLALLLLILSQRRWTALDPRCLVPLFVFLALAGAVLVDKLFSRSRVLAYAALGAVVALNIASGVRLSPALHPVQSLWPYDHELAGYLEEAGIAHPNASPWIAYALAFETAERVVPTPIGGGQAFGPEDRQGQGLGTHYLFRMRAERDRIFDTFGEDLGEKQWTARGFAEFLRSLGVPDDAYEVKHFTHYALYDVPRAYLDPAVIHSGLEPDVTGLRVGAPGYLSRILGARDLVILNPPELLPPLEEQLPDGVEVHRLTEPPGDVRAKHMLATQASQHRRLFVLYGDTSSSDPHHQLEQWLNQNTYRADDRWLGEMHLVVYGTTVLPPASQPTQMRGARFGDQIELTGTDLPLRNVAPGEVLPFTLFWQAHSPIREPLKVFAHLVTEEGRLVAQRDSEPVGGLAPTDTWTVDKRVVDRYGILLPETLQPGSYELVEGLYNPRNSNRLPVSGGDGEQTGDSLTIGAIAVAAEQ